MQLLNKKIEEQDKKIGLLELEISNLLRAMSETVNPILLQHETYLHNLENKSWLRRFLGL